MRDQWRVDDDNRHLRDHRGREHSLRRDRSPILSRRPEGPDLGLKIKGRATVESPPQLEPRRRERSRSTRREISKASPLTGRRKANGEGFKRSRELSEERLPKRSRARDTSPPTRSHRRRRSTTPDHRAREPTYHERRRDQDRSPIYADRGVTRPDKRQGRAYSPTFPPRRDNYLSSRERLPSPQARSIGDSYIPLVRGGRSRSPKSRNHYRPEVSRRTSRSPGRYNRHREDHHSRSHVSRRESPHRGRKSSPRASVHRERSIDSSTTRKGTGSKSSRRSEKQKLRTLKHLVNKPRKPDRNTSPSPIRTARKDDRRMQSSTRPIQSILDEQPRQPSPPRPIPSFDDSNGSVDSHIRDAFPMHGMKASDIHPGQRRIPSHIDTRQPFATSPQYMTPTSSHHGSPQSGSPYSRGSWASQQHFHGQSG